MRMYGDILGTNSQERKAFVSCVTALICSEFSEAIVDAPSQEQTVTQINSLPERDQCVLIMMFDFAITHIDHPTEKMKRLYQLKWVL